MAVLNQVSTGSCESQSSSFPIRVRARLSRMLSRRALGQKNFNGSLWDRFEGLDHLLDRCEGTSVLDLASCEGMVSYEFARRGATLIHGFERDIDRVRFSRRLFRDVPIETQFESANLAVSRAAFVGRNKLLPYYDIVLFLGIYHHLARQMEMHTLQELVSEFLARTNRYFAVRTGSYQEFEPLVLDHGFELVSALSGEEQVCGAVRIYERKS